MVRGDKFISLILVFLLILLSFSVFAIEPDAVDINAGETSTSSDETPSNTESETDFDKTGVPSEETTEITEQESSYTWLDNEVKADTSDLESNVLAIMAFLINGKNDETVSALINRIEVDKDVNNGCWPIGNCNVKETALGSLAMHLTGHDDEADKGFKWIESAKTSGLSTGGSWRLVLKSSESGGCEVKLSTKTKTYTIENDAIKESSNKYYVDLAEFGRPALRELQPELNVACLGLPGSVISLIYSPSNSVFFVQESHSGDSMVTKLSNSCFGKTARTSKCDYESTLYATWALVEAGHNVDELGVNLYLQSQVSQNNAKQLALLNRILFKSGKVAPSFLEDLVKLQSISDGSWNRDIFTTSLTVFSLVGSDRTEEVEKGSAYLERKRGDDGSFEKNIRSTSMALIALQGADLVKKTISESTVKVLGDVASGKNAEECGNQIDDDGDLFADCGDVDCEVELSALCTNNRLDDCETETDCGGFCGECGSEDVSVTLECTLDTDCTEGQECSTRGKCVSITKKDEGTGAQVVPQKKSLLWLWILLVIIVLGLIGFFVYYIKKNDKSFGNLFNKKKGPSFNEYRRQAEFKPIMPHIPPKRPMTGFKQPLVRKPINNKEEDELEKSIKEAQRIIKGK